MLFRRSVSLYSKFFFSLDLHELMLFIGEPMPDGLGLEEVTHLAVLRIFLFKTLCAQSQCEAVLFDLKGFGILIQRSFCRTIKKVLHLFAR